jgi:hypothetical protein
VRNDRAFLVKVDIEAFGEPALYEEGGSVTMIAAESLAARATSPVKGRVHDTAFLHHALREGREELLRGSRGTFLLLISMPRTGDWCSLRTSLAYDFCIGGLTAKRSYSPAPYGCSSRSLG